MTLEEIAKEVKKLTIGELKALEYFVFNVRSDLQKIDAERLKNI